LLNRKFHIYDADESTRDYFRSELGIELQPQEDVQLPERVVPRAPTPPYTGYGSWDDSMSSVIRLVPKAPKTDFDKLYYNDGKVLRYTARFANPKPEDVDRLFVINFHLCDDSLSIHEPPQRNLGIVTGKFLEKGVYLNQNSGKFFEPEDFFPRNTIKVFNHEFQILDMDKYTEKKMEDPSVVDCSIDLVAVLEKLRESMRQQFPLVRDLFRRFDSDHDGVLTFNEFWKALQKFGFLLSDEELLVIMKHFDKRQDGQVTYNEFCDALLDEDYTPEMLKVKPPLTSEYDRSYGKKTLKKSRERRETEMVRKAVREIGDVLYKRTGMVQKLFKEFEHMTHQNTVTSDQIRVALERLGHSFKIEDITRCILFVQPHANLNTIRYVEFFKSLVASYHDVSALR